MKIYVMLVIFLFHYVESKTFQHFEIIEAYLQKTNFKFAVVINCWSKSDVKLLTKLLQSNNIRSCNYNVEGYLNQSSIYSNGMEAIINVIHVLDSSCHRYQELLQKMVLWNHFRNIYKWLILLNDDNVENHIDIIHNNFSNVSLRWDSDIKVATYSNNNNESIIYDIYNPAFGWGGEIQITIYGIYDMVSKELILRQMGTAYSQRKNVKNITMRVGTVALYKPSNLTLDQYMTDRTLRLDIISKFHYALFKHLEEIHEFNSSFTIENRWVGDTPSGKDLGVARLLYEGKVEVTATSATIILPRISYYEFICPIYRFRSCFIFRNEGYHDLFNKVFLEPFTESVWFACLFCAILIAIVLKIIYWAEHTFMKVIDTHSWFTATFLTIVVFTQRSLDLYPTHLSGRTLYLNLLLFSVLLYNYYTSSIVSTIISAKPATMDNMGELLHSKFTVGIEDAPYTFTYFLNKSNDIEKMLYKTKILTYDGRPNIYTPFKGVEKVKKGGFAYHTEDNTAYSIIDKTFEQEQICELDEINVVGPFYTAFLGRKFSQYKIMFKVSLRQIVTAGIARRQEFIWRQSKPLCFSKTRVLPVAVESVFPAFLLYAIGILFAMIIFIFEIIYYRLHELENNMVFDFRL